MNLVTVRAFASASKYSTVYYGAFLKTSLAQTTFATWSSKCETAETPKASEIRSGSCFVFIFLISNKSYISISEM